MSTYRSPLLDLPGAVEADAPDAGVAAHYGDPMLEQRRLEAGQAVVDLSHRGVVRIAGADRLSWLHSLLTQHVQSLEPGRPTQALLLDPQGRVEHHLRLVDDGEAAWATVEPGTAGALVDFLRSMQFMLRVEVFDVSDEWAVLGTADGERLLPLADLPGIAGSTQVVGVWAHEARRIARGEPRLGLDTDARTIPNEVGWLDAAVHLDKGCYRGQETVARVHTLGRPPRRLTLLHLDGSVDTLPAHCDRVRVLDSPSTEVGFVGSAARHYELGPIALALLKRNVPVDTPLVVRVGDVWVAASQEPLVDPEVGLHVRPRLRWRLGRVWPSHAETSAGSTQAPPAAPVSPRLASEQMWAIGLSRSDAAAPPGGGTRGVRALRPSRCAQ